MMKIRKKDIEVRRYRSLGWSTEVVHLPTGIIVVCTDAVSAPQQRFRALLALARRLREETV